MAAGQADWTRQVAVKVIDTTDPMVVQVSSAGSGQLWIDGRTASFEDSSFVSGDSPATHDVNGALGRNAHDGYIHNAGSGDLKYEISDDGTNFGGLHTLKAGAKAKLTGLNIDTIRVTWVADTEYYIAVV